MKYYVMKNKEYNGYLSRNLCRINSKGIFEIYDSCTGECFGKWIKNEKYENWFNEKSDDFEIYVPTKKEIESIIFEVDDAAYENYHTYVSPRLVDSKGREHSEYIYQDYRSLDGYNADTGFEYNEIWNREDYDYYKYNNKLIKRNKETMESFVLENDWKKCEEKIDFNKLELITDFNKVLEDIEKRFTRIN